MFDNLNTGTLWKVAFWGFVGVVVVKMFYAPNQQVQEHQSEVKQFVQEAESKKRRANALVDGMIDQLNALNIQDMNLKECIGMQIHYHETRIRQNVWTNLTDMEELGCSSRKISQLEGLQHFTKLKTLNLANNELTYLAPLSALGQLERLNIGGNPISSVWMLSGFGQLDTLELGELPLTNFREVLQFSNVRKLSFRIPRERMYSCDELGEFSRAVQGKNWSISYPSSCLNFDGNQERFRR